MKFGKKLRFRAVYPWIPHYINYKRLKKIIKQRQGDDDVAEQFEAAFLAELGKVDDFYTEQFRQLQAEIRSLTERCGDYIASNTCTLAGVRELEQLLYHLSCELSKLVDYAEVNVTGFRKIAKKFTKKTQIRSTRLMQATHARAVASKHVLGSTSGVLESALSELSLFKRHLVESSHALNVTPAGSVKERLRLVLRRGDTKHLVYLLQSSSVTPILFAMHGPSLMHLAATADDTACVAILADNGVAVGALNVVDETPLATAVKHGSARVAKLLLSLGAGLESSTYLQTNPLHHAVKAKSRECVQLLLDHATSQGLDVLRKLVAHLDRDAFSVAYHACIRNLHDVLPLLLDAAARASESGGDTPRNAKSHIPTPVPRECTCEDRLVSNFLEKRHGNDAAVWTCLNAAAYAGATECLRILTERLCPACIRERVAASSSTALHSAARSGHLECCRVLVDAGAPVCALNAYSETPMHLACQAANAECLQVMLTKAPPHALRARLSLERYIANSPPTLSMRSVDVYIPLLMQAVEAESEQCVTALLDAGAHPLEETVDGWSALALALFGGQQSRNSIVDVLRARAKSVGSPVKGAHKPPVIARPVGATPPLPSSGPVTPTASPSPSPPTLPGVAHSVGSGVGTASVGSRGSGGDSGSEGASTASDNFGLGAFAKPGRVKVEKCHPKQSPSERGKWELQIMLGTIAAKPEEMSHRMPGVSLVSFPRSDRMIRNRVTVDITQCQSRPQDASRKDTSKAGNMGLERFLEPSADDAVAKASAGVVTSPATDAAPPARDGLPPLALGFSRGAGAGAGAGSTASAMLGARSPSSGRDRTPSVGSSADGSQFGDGDDEADATQHSMTLTLYRAWSFESTYTWETLPPGVSREADDVLTFTGTSPAEFGLRIDVSPSVGATLGRAFVSWDLLRREKEFSSNKAMEGQITVPLLGPGLVHVGAVSFRYTFILPFSLPVKIPRSTFTWKTTEVWGHRGTGADNSSYGIGPVGARTRRTHVVENTLLAFVTASSMGASYIEFDVHLSRDHVPVIHHNYLVNLGGGITVPVSHLTAEELQRVTPHAEPAGDAVSAADATSGGTGAAAAAVSSPTLDRVGSAHVRRRAGTDWNEAEGGRAKLARTKSLTRDARTMLAMGVDPAKHTRLAKHSGRIADTFITLETAFNRVPSGTGFNVEIKYPNNKKEELQTLKSPPRNMLVDKVLEVVFRCHNGRDVLFSSFDPGVCTMLARKQSVYPVFFLTDAGGTLYADPRKNSLRQAIQFAKAAHLFGIVSQAAPLVECPRLITEVRSAGLVLCTYGKVNNDVSACLLQKRFGVAAVIVDHVTHISKHMRGDQRAEHSRSAAGATVTAGGASTAAATTTGAGDAGAGAAN